MSAKNCAKQITPIDRVMLRRQLVYYQKGQSFMPLVSCFLQKPR
jgi:hypothetical protein